MSAIKDKIINEIITREGGYVNHPSDKGGPTMYGITEKVARANGYKGPMMQLPRSLAVHIYENEYWNINNLDAIEQISALVAAEIADTGVNMGTNTAAVFLQRVLNAMNRQGKDYADLVIDGQLGNKTIAAFQAYMAKRGHEDGIKVMLRALNCLQGERYIQISQTRPANEDFVFGWFAHRIS